MVSSRFRPATVIGGKWVLDRPLGRGGMGEVWVAKHTSLDEEVALKLLDRGAFPADVLEEARSRFHLEAQLAARLAKKSRHIAGVVDHGHEGDFDYLVLELLRGSPLDAYLAQAGRVGPSQVSAIVRQVSRGLAVAHREGVVHRDLKPGNVFITQDDEGGMLVKLLDFGIAKAAARPQRPITVEGVVGDGEVKAEQDAPKSSHRTRVGIVLGTPEYMSPEQARGQVVDGRADVWALACIAFELLTGVVPFSGESETDVMINVCMGRRVLARDVVPELPEAIEDLFTHAFELEIEKRFVDAATFSAALDNVFGERASLVDVSLRSVPTHGPGSGQILEPSPILLTPVAVATTTPPAAEPAAKRSRAAWAAGAVLVALIAAFFVFRASASSPTRAAAEPPPPTVTAVPSTKEATAPHAPAIPPTEPVAQPTPVVPAADPTAHVTPGGTVKGKTPPSTPTAKAKPPPPAGKKPDPSEIL